VLFMHKLTEGSEMSPKVFSDFMRLEFEID
jgi:hypothetical protein